MNAVSYVRRYEREPGLFDAAHVVILVAAVAFIVFAAIYDEVRRPHDIARPACEMAGETWVVLDRRYDPYDEIMGCAR